MKKVVFTFIEKTLFEKIEHILPAKIKINISYIKSPKGIILVVLIASERVLTYFRPNPFFYTIPMTCLLLLKKRNTGILVKI